MQRHDSKTRNNRILKVAKRFVPQSLKQKVQDTLQQGNLSVVLKEIRSLPAGTLPPAEVLLKLESVWNNEGFAARIEYLRAVAQHALQAQGPILECGSGLTTLILGIFGAQRGVETWTLENSPAWHRRLTETLRRQNVGGVHNCLASLRNYGSFSWYDPAAHNLPDKVRLVVCDGPPGTTHGGRYGLVPIMQSRLSAGTVILLDDADREAETEAVSRWSELLDLEISRQQQSRGEFAIITIRGWRK